MAAEYLKEVRESLEVCDSETFNDIFFAYRKAGLPECINIAFESVMDLAEFIVIVEEAGSYEGLKEIMENIYEDTGENLLLDAEGREPDIESMPVKTFKEALVHRFDTDDFDAVKEAIVSEFLMPGILEGLKTCSSKECAGEAEALEFLKTAGWL